MIFNRSTITRTRTIAGAAGVVAVTGITACGAGGSAGGGNAAANLNPLAATSKSAPATTSTSASPAPSASTTRKAATKAASTTRLVTTTQTVGYGTQRRYTSTMAAGATKVTRLGVAGTETVTTKQTLSGSRVTASNVVQRKITRAPVNRVVLIGTEKAAPAPTPYQPSSGGLNLAHAAMWDRIAACESGGDWSINTGNGYYGGLQFSASTWLANGGGQFAARADLASRAEQITVANRLYAKSGLAPWGCAGAA
ncbi:resuscitation-promoting factor [Rudaeicoccus suwonensis]|uniref:resuscitation-promoting factor n=1 Tax=Rudaeicoccus suwonensis TaxID=657409 RepID=UPI00319DE842